jgi:hypothetical protein
VLAATQTRDLRTCFQTGHAYSDWTNLKADVAIVYGIDAEVGDRINSWRTKGYEVHVMTGVSWGEYQDYLYGRFDGVNHLDEAQTESNGNKISHGGDVYYMCPGQNFGNFLCVGVQRALDAGAGAIYLEEPEFWVRSGWSEGFKREWKDYYKEEWQAPDSSPDAQWRASKLKYFLYRRALQQVFDYIQAYNHAQGKHVRCYVPTHSLLNYAQWKIVSPESSLARLNGCDGYIAQVWTGTARTPNIYKGVSKERTFETAFLEYGAMQNLVRATGRSVWYLADPVEDDPSHDWDDYRRNYEATLTASLLQPDVWHYEVTPWPERVWGDKYPDPANRKRRIGIPDPYTSELQVVMNALKDMKQSEVEWDCGTQGIGVAVSDTLMFERGGPQASDEALSHFYGLAMPFVKRGMPVRPVQLESVDLPHYLDGVHVLLMSYQGMKPPSEETHEALATWVRGGGTLVFVDDDSDPFNHVREWWNSDGNKFGTPREHLFGLLAKPGKGKLIFLHRNPVDLAKSSSGDEELADAVKPLTSDWTETGSFVLRRGPYIIAAGLSESPAQPRALQGTFVDLFDPDLALEHRVDLAPDTCHFLIDLDKCKDREVVACGGQAKVTSRTKDQITVKVEGIENASSMLLVRTGWRPCNVTIDGGTVSFRTQDGLTWVPLKTSAKGVQIEISRKE